MSNIRINVSDKDKNTIITALANDIHILEECNIIDYSLLLGVINDKTPARGYEFYDKDNTDIKYALGIIDYG